MRKVSRYAALILAAVIMLAGLGSLGGCGRKGPPLPPLSNGNIIASPINLAYTLDNGWVRLTWDHKVDPVDARISPEGFEVFVATKSVEGCPGCPFIFKLAGMVAMPQKVFTSELQPGLNYYFRLQAVGSNDMRSEFSKTVNIERE